MSTTTTTVEASPPIVTDEPKSTLPALEICSTGDIIISLTPEPPAPKPKSKDDPDVPEAIPEKPKPLRFRVSSSVLCAASPVFNAMLGPNSKFAEALSLRKTRVSSSPEDSQSVHHIQPLYDDNGTALAVILYALHLQTHKVPRSVTFAQLKQLAVVCDKYDCVGAVRLWAETWMEPWKRYMNAQGYEDWLFIAWVFSSRDVFGKVSKALVPRIVVGEDEAGNRMVCWAKWKGRERERLGRFDTYVPDVILNALLKQRNTIVKEIVMYCSTTFTKYVSGTVQLCKHVPKDPRCDIYILGSLYQAFLGIGMLGSDIKTVDNYSVQELVEAIKGIKIQHLDYDGWGEVEVTEEEEVPASDDAEANAGADEVPPGDDAEANAGADVVVTADAVVPDANAEIPNNNADVVVDGDPPADPVAVTADAVVAPDDNPEPNADNTDAVDAAVNINANANANAESITDANAVNAANAEAIAEGDAANTNPTEDANTPINPVANIDGNADGAVDVNPNTEANPPVALQTVEGVDEIVPPTVNVEVAVEQDPDTNVEETSPDANAENAVNPTEADDENINATANPNPDDNVDVDVNVNIEPNPNVPVEANTTDNVANDIAIAAAATEEVEDATPPPPEPEPEPEGDPTPPPPPVPRTKMAHIRHEHNTTCNPLKALIELAEEEAGKIEELNLAQFRGWKRKKMEKKGGNWAKLTEELEVAMVGV